MTASKTKNEKKPGSDPLACFNKVSIAYTDFQNQIHDSKYVSESKESKTWLKIIVNRLKSLEDLKTELKKKHERCEKHEAIIDSRETARKVGLEIEKLEKLRKVDLVGLISDPLLLRKQRDIGEETDVKIQNLLRNVWNRTRKLGIALGERYDVAVDAVIARNEGV